MYGTKYIFYFKFRCYAFMCCIQLIKHVFIPTLCKTYCDWRVKKILVLDAILIFILYIQECNNVFRFLIDCKCTWIRVHLLFTSLACSTSYGGFVIFYDTRTKDFRFLFPASMCLLSTSFCFHDTNLYSIDANKRKF